MNLTPALRHVERRLKPVVQILCAYEVIALALPRNPYTPPISVVVNRHKWIMPVVIPAVIAHCWWLEAR